jgi:hypothetical protein
MKISVSGVSLLELLIALVLFSVLIVGISSIQSFSTYHVLSADIRSSLYKDLTYVLEDMTKNIQVVTGDAHDPGIQDIPGSGFRARIDVNAIQTPGIYGDDTWIDYTISGNRILKNGVSLNSRDIILPVANGGFVWSILNNGSGVKIDLKGRHDPSSAVSTYNPEMAISMTAYSRSASAN